MIPFRCSPALPQLALSSVALSVLPGEFGHCCLANGNSGHQFCKYKTCSNGCHPHQSAWWGKNQAFLMFGSLHSNAPVCHGNCIELTMLKLKSCSLGGTWQVTSHPCLRTESYPTLPCAKELNTIILGKKARREERKRRENRRLESLWIWMYVI